MNPVLWILVIAGGVFAINTAKAANTGNKSSIKLLNVDSLKMVGSEFEISATIAIDNPTGNTISIKKPYLRAYLNGNEIGNSIPSEEYKPIMANARTEIKNVNLRIPFTSVPALVSAALFSKATDQLIKLETATVVNGIPIKDEKEFKVAELIKVLKK